MLKKQIIASLTVVALAGPLTLLIVAGQAEAGALLDMRVWLWLWLALLLIAPLTPLCAAAWKKARLLDEEPPPDAEKSL